MTARTTKPTIAVVWRVLTLNLLVVLVAATPVSAMPERWQPAPGLSWQVQFSGRLDLSLKARVWDLDMFDTSRRTVARLHERGRRVVCYINAGAWENWRPDSGRYPRKVRGRALAGWPGERWLDIRRLDVLGPILRDRLALCRSKGFDAVEFDNVDGYSNRSGFDLTAADQLAFNRWLADEAHASGLAVGLKNTLSLAEELEPHFDFAILEQCFYYDECRLAAPFIEAGKPVLDIEYELTRRDFCAAAGELGVVAMRKRLSLGSWRRSC